MLTLMNNAAVDELASSLAKRYYGTDNPAIRCLDVDGFAKCCRLPIAYAAFWGKDSDKFAYLSDGTYPVTVCDEQGMHDIVYPAGTIVVHRSLTMRGMDAQRRFTIAHELGHHFLSRITPETPEPLFNSDFSPAAQYSQADFTRLFSVREMQANRFASSLLMPDFCVRSSFAEHFGSGAGPVSRFGNFQFTLDDKLKLSRMADEMGVSFTALMYRLASMGLIVSRPIEEFLAMEEFGD